MPERNEHFDHWKERASTLIDIQQDYLDQCKKCLEDDLPIPIAGFHSHEIEILKAYNQEAKKL